MVRRSNASFKGSGVGGETEGTGFEWCGRRRRRVRRDLFLRQRWSRSSVGCVSVGDLRSTRRPFRQRRLCAVLRCGRQGRLRLDRGRVRRLRAETFRRAGGPHSVGGHHLCWEYEWAPLGEGRKQNKVGQDPRAPSPSPPSRRDSRFRLQDHDSTCCFYDIYRDSPASPAFKLLSNQFSR